jgi:acetyl esterase/lipase
MLLDDFSHSLPFPVVFYVHGGAWLEGTKTLCPLDGFIGLVKRGYAVVSVNYRLAPAVVFPEFLFDVKTAVRWGRAHAAQYGFDPGRFAMTGDSAGGHLTLMAAFTAGQPQYAGEQYGWAEESDALQAICDLYGPTILADPLVPFYQESGVPRAMYDFVGVPTFFDIAFGTGNKSLLDLISPIHHVHKDIPPVLILHGRPDGVIPYQHSELLFEKINEVCGEGRAEILLYEDRNHADHAFNTDENAAVIAAFFDRYLK